MQTCRAAFTVVDAGLQVGRPFSADPPALSLFSDWSDAAAARVCCLAGDVGPVGFAEFSPTASRPISSNGRRRSERRATERRGGGRLRLTSRPLPGSRERGASGWLRLRTASRRSAADTLLDRAPPHRQTGSSYLESLPVPNAMPWPTIVPIVRAIANQPRSIAERSEAQPTLRVSAPDMTEFIVHVGHSCR
jgi:hypothetical protein